MRFPEDPPGNEIKLKMKKITILLFFLSATFGMHAQDNTYRESPLKIGRNYRIYPSNVNQTEVFLVKSPVEKNTLFAACNDN